MNIQQRKSKTKTHYDQLDRLHLDTQHYRKQVDRYIIFAIKDDAGKDSTSKKFFKRSQKITASVVANEPGVLAGMEELLWVCRKFSICVEKSKIDGSTFKTGSTLAMVSGDARTILGVERTVLNMVQRMSGIATRTASYKRKIGPYPILAATRKTLWGNLDKKAVALGGGYTHRLNLADAIMVKDNHLQTLEQFDDIQFIHFKRKQFKEIEIDTTDQLKHILRLQLPYDAILFDNFTPDRIKQALRWLEKKGVRNRYICEASGGIDETSLLQYAKTGVDVISIGSLTHSARALDIGLDVIV